MNLLERSNEPLQLRVTERSEGFAATKLELKLTEALRILPERREVYAGRLLGAERAVVAKRFLSHPKQARDWRREWDGLLTLEALNLSAPRPLCVAEEPDGSAVWVVMDRIEGAVSVLDGFDHGDRDERAELAQQLAKLVDAAHRAGVRQGDQHVDNWAWDGARRYLLAAGSIEFSKHALPERARLLDLAGICVTLAPAAEQAFCAAIDTVYLIDDTDLKGRLLYELEGAIVSLQGERTRRYFKKTRRSCTEFVRVDTATYRAVHVRHADAELIDALLNDPEALMVEGERLKAGNTCTVQGFSSGGQAYVLKRYNKKPLVDRLRKVFSDSRALTSWSSAWVLDMAFIPTGRAVAVYEDGQERLPGLRYLLMERIEGQLLPDYVKSCEGDLARVEAMADDFAQIWASLGRLRAAHGDLKATNLIVGTEGRLHLFDLDAFRFGLGTRAFERGRAKDLKRFMKNWSDRSELAQLFEAKIREVSE
jgi:aminoglycoside phosphotransferase (APT) family kinase protein